MKRIPLRYFVFALSLLAVVPAFAFKDVKQWEDRTLNKTRESSVNLIGFIKLFDAALYLENEHQPEDFPGDFSYALSLRYEKNLKRETLIKTADSILQDLHSSDALKQIEAQLLEINEYYLDVNKGDAYTLVYQPGQGTTLLYNNERLVTIPGEEFAKIYFSIWLGGHPKTKDLKRDLLEN